ncbi:MAG: serine hydrolase [Myxococcaceae bacterium]
MSHTQWRDDFRRVVKGRAIAYEAAKDGYRQRMPFEDAYGNGGLLTTVSDLLRWNDALTAGELGTFVTTEIQRQATLDTGRSIAYSRGLFVEPYHGVREIAHGGATAGYRAWLGRYPEHYLSIALLCNAGNVNAAALAHKVADIFLPTQVPARRTTVRLTADQLARRAGLYVDLRMGLPLRLEVQGDALRVSSGPVLVATSLDEFIAGSTTFRFNGSDRLTRETADDDVRQFRLAQPWQPSSSQLTRFAGDYTSDEAMATCHVTVKGNLLVLAPEDRCGEELILHPIFADTFEFASDDVGGVLHFSVNFKGKVSSFEMSDSRVHALVFSRTAGHDAACARTIPQN